MYREIFLFGVISNGLRSLVIWDYSLSVRGILIATVCRPIRRTGRLASCKVTIRGGGGLTFYRVVNGLRYTQDVYFVTGEILVVSAFNYTYSINSLYSATLPNCCKL